MVYYIVNQNKGVLIGQHKDHLYFSDIDTAGMATAITFSDRNVADSVCVTLNKKLDGIMKVEVAVAESETVGKAFCKKNGLKWQDKRG